MKQFAIAVSLVAFLAVGSFGQNAPLPSTNVVTNFSAVALPGNQETLAATIADIGFTPTPNSNLFLETIQSPSAPNLYGFYGAGISYQINELSKLINNISPNLSGYKFRFTLIGSGGEVRVGDRNHVGGTARFRTEYALTSGGGYNLAFEVGAARLPGVSPKWGKLFSVGQAIHF